MAPSILAIVLLSTVAVLAETPSTKPATPAAWAFHGGGSLLGRAPELPPPPMKLRWTYRCDEDGDAGIDGAPVIDGSRVYVADGKGILHAIDLKTGQRTWTYPTGSDGCTTTPLLCGDRVLIGDVVGVVHAVSIASGERLWTHDTGSPINGSINAAAPGAARAVVVNDGGKILCLDVASGDVAWTAQAGDRINGAAAIAGDTVYIAGCDAKLLALNLADGKERFAAADIGALSGGSPAVLEDRIVVGTDEGRVVCLSRDGQRQHWTYEQIGNKAMAYSSAAVSDGGIVVIGARDRQVHAIDLASGKQLWTFKARLDVDSSPLVSGGRVYVGSKDKSLYVLDLKRGELVWEFKASRGIPGSPAIGEGVLVIGDDAGNVYCLDSGSQ